MADAKLTGLTEITNPTLTDILYLVSDPGGSAASKKVTLDNLQNKIVPIAAEGDLLIGSASGSVATLPIGSGSYVLTSNGTTAAWAAAGGGSLNDYILIQDQKAQNTDGGTFTSGAWRTRDLNTEVSDTGGHASVASNQITLAAGTYITRILAPADLCGRHQAILYNVTDAATTLTGTSQYLDNARINTTQSVIVGKFAIAALKVFEVRHQCEYTASGNGFGQSCNYTTEIYTIAEFWKVA